MFHTLLAAYLGGFIAYSGALLRTLIRGGFFEMVKGAPLTRKISALSTFMVESVFWPVYLTLPEKK